MTRSTPLKRMLPTTGVDYVVGGAVLTATPRIPYDDIVCAFLADLAAALRKDARSQAYPDLLTFAFWCRKANIQHLKADFNNTRIRLGRGVAFHVTPSNVPVNFAFSLAFGMLAGNANVVRLSSRDTPQTEILCDVIAGTLKGDTYRELRHATALMRYTADDNLTAAFSAAADARIIWGGDDTVAEIRKHPLPARAVEIAFADRYSFCVMDMDAVAALSDEDLGTLARRFYNDTYLMDQQACSSPHLVVWTGSEDEAKTRFWEAVRTYAEKEYTLTAVQAVDKYTSVLKAAIGLDEVCTVIRHGIEVYRADLTSLPEQTAKLRGAFGTFFEFDTQDLSSLADIIGPKFQTLTYFGVAPEQFCNLVIDNRLTGIDRIVPVGKALDMAPVWDGYEVVDTLSRIVDIA